MLTIPFKVGTESDISSAFHRHLCRTLSDSEADKFSNDLLTLQTHRSSTLRPTSESGPALAVYYQHITQAEPYFPVSDTSCTVSFTWSDAWRGDRQATLSSLKFERASILFNIGASAASQGATMDQGSVEGLKAACKLFMQAAGAFDAVSEIGGQIRGARTFDLSSDGLRLASSLMLAQAQACFFQKAVLDRRSASAKPLRSNIIAGLAARAAELYGHALEGCRSAESAVPLVDESWVAQMAFQRMCFDANASYWAGKGEAERGETEGTGFGPAIAHYSRAHALILDAIASGDASGVDATLLASSEALRDRVAREKRTLEDDNAKVYHEVVPSPDRLSPIQRIAMVRAQPPAALLGDLLRGAVPGRLFQGLLPGASQAPLQRFHRSASESLRSAQKHLRDANAEAKNALARLGLPAALEAQSEDGSFPEGLLHKMGLCQRRAGRALLRAQLESVRRLGAEARALAQRAVAAVDREDRAHMDFAARVVRGGAPWSGASSATLLAEHRKDALHLQHLLSQAGESDAQLQQRVSSASMDTHYRLLEASRPQLDAMMPRADASAAGATADGLLPMYNDGAYDTRDLKRMLVRLAQLLERRERAAAGLDYDAVLEDLRANMLLVARERGFGGPNAPPLTPEPFDAAADEALRRVDGAVSEAMALLGAEAALLGEIGAENARFEASRERDPVNARRQQLFAACETAVSVCDEVSAQLSEGAAFYSGAVERLQAVCQAVEDIENAQQLRRDEYVSTASSRAQLSSQEESDARLAKQLAEALSAEEEAAERKPEGRAEPPAGKKGSLFGWLRGSGKKDAASRDPAEAKAAAPEGANTEEDAEIAAAIAASLAETRSASPPPQPMSLAPQPSLAARRAPTLGGTTTQPPSFSSLGTAPQGAPQSFGPAPTLGGAPPPQADAGAVQRLVAMGFDAQLVRVALQNANGDEQVALNALLG